jgi:hypothetical protein
MNWRQLVFPVLAAVVAGAVWFWSPDLLDRVGLGEFLFVGRLCLIMLALTIAERIFSRIRGHS